MGYHSLPFNIVEKKWYIHYRGELSLYYPTCNFIAGISSRLRGKIIRFIMYDHGLTNDFPCGKSIRQKHQKSISLVAEQWRHVTCVIWMGTILWIIMCHGVSEWVCCITGTASTGMNVKAKDRTFAGIRGTGQSKNLRHYHDSQLGLIKIYISMQIRMFCTAFDGGSCSRVFSSHGNTVYTVIIVMIHSLHNG